LRNGIIENTGSFINPCYCSNRTGIKCYCISPVNGNVAYSRFKSNGEGSNRRLAGRKTTKILLWGKCPGIVAPAVSDTDTLPLRGKLQANLKD
jgi:hypothetical protein